MALLLSTFEIVIDLRAYICYENNTYKGLRA